MKLGEFPEGGPPLLGNLLGIFAIHLLPTTDDRGIRLVAVNHGRQIAPSLLPLDRRGLGVDPALVREVQVALHIRLAELRVFDNSFEADPHVGRAPQPTLILHIAKGKILEMVDLAETPQWAKAFVAAAVKMSK